MSRIRLALDGTLSGSWTEGSLNIRIDIPLSLLYTIGTQARMSLLQAHSHSGCVTLSCIDASAYYYLFRSFLTHRSGRC